MAEALVLFCIVQIGGDGGRFWGGGGWVVISFFLFFFSLVLFFSAERDFIKRSQTLTTPFAVGSFAKLWFSCVSCVVRIKTNKKPVKKRRKRKKKGKQKQDKKKKYPSLHLNLQSSIQSEYLS